MAEAGPLAPAELDRLEATLLPARERHHLRLLAHCLRTFQQIATCRRGALPQRPALEAWLAAQPAIAADPGFRRALLDQLQHAALELDRLAASLGLEPLALDLDDLITWAEAEARARLNPAAPPRRSG